jgi:ABC-type antimicrobial peptide transport system permease subunit
MLNIQYLEDSWGQARSALREHRLRTMMSIVGVAVGIAAVMIVSIVSQTGRQYVFAELETFGLNTIWVYRHYPEQTPNTIIRSGSGIDNDDYNALSNGCCSAVRRFSPVVYMEEWQRSIRMGSNFTKSNVEGVGLEYLKINNDSLQFGRNFRDEDIKRRRPVALLGPKTAGMLFGRTRSPIGQSIYVDDLKVTVIGVLNDKNREFLSAIGATSGYDINDRVLIPYTLYQQKIGNQDIHTLQAESTGLKYTDAAIAQILKVLNRRNKNRYQYNAESMQQWVDTANSILRVITVIGIVAASVSLIVGGIGIMNIMSTSVIERTREIGLRKALGARRNDIQNQFLTEALMISGMGGIFGLGIGISVMFVVAYFTGFGLIPSWQLVLVAVCLSMVVGIASGYVPAYKAARLSPVAALKYE